MSASAIMLFLIAGSLAFAAWAALAPLGAPFPLAKFSAGAALLAVALASRGCALDALRCRGPSRWWRGRRAALICHAMPDEAAAALAESELLGAASRAAQASMAGELSPSPRSHPRRL